MTQASGRPALAAVLSRVPAVGRWSPSPRLRRMLPFLAVLVLALVVIAGLAVAPVSTWFRQREQTRSAEAELQELQAEVSRLDARLQELRTDEAVERIAREHYDLVFPGEESFRILPAPEPEPAPEASEAP